MPTSFINQVWGGIAVCYSYLNKYHFSGNLPKLGFSTITCGNKHQVPFGFGLNWFECGSRTEFDFCTFSICIWHKEQHGDGIVVRKLLWEAARHATYRKGLQAKQNVLGQMKGAREETTDSLVCTGFQSWEARMRGQPQAGNDPM